MEKRTFTRRQVLATASVGALATIANWPLKAIIISGKDDSKLAIHGGEPIRAAVPGGYVDVTDDAYQEGR